MKRKKMNAISLDILKKRQYLVGILVVLLMTVYSCKKEAAPEPEQETGTVTDIDGNVYKTVKIDEQWWMAENLRVTKYRDGSTIPSVSSENTTYDVWANNSTGAHTGDLYNWAAVNDIKQIAPEGWHVPSDTEWKQLECHIGMSPAEADNTSWRGTNEGDKLKKEWERINFWTQYGNVWPTNESGFTVIPNGVRLPDGSFGDNLFHEVAFFWTSTPHENEAWYRYLDYKKSSIFRYYGSTKYGQSIRCIKD